MNFYPAPDTSSNENGRIARRGERAAEGRTAMRVLAARSSPTSTSPTESKVERDGKRLLTRSTLRPAGSLALRAAGVAWSARTIICLKGACVEVQVPAFEDGIWRYIWTLGQIFSTAFMNRSR